MRAGIVEDGNNLNSKIDEVRVFVNYFDNKKLFTEEIAKGSFANGGFTITLPDNIDSKFLDSYSDNDYEEGIKISKKSFKKTYEEVGFTAYKNGVRVGKINYEISNWGVSLIYVDGDVDITGSSSANIGDLNINTTYSVSLKKGWNFWYHHMTHNEFLKTNTSTSTTKDPGGLKWVFKEY